MKSKHEQERLNRLQKRAVYLQESIDAKQGSFNSLQYKMSEVSALNWAIEKIINCHCDEEVS